MHRVHWLFCLDTLLVGLPSTVSLLDGGYSRNVSSVLNYIYAFLLQISLNNLIDNLAKGSDLIPYITLLFVCCEVILTDAELIGNHVIQISYDWSIVSDKEEVIWLTLHR